MKLKDILTMVAIMFFSYTLFHFITSLLWMAGLDAFIILGVVVISIGFILIILDAIIVFFKKNILKIVKVEKKDEFSR